MGSEHSSPVQTQQLALPKCPLSPSSHPIRRSSNSSTEFKNRSGRKRLGSNDSNDGWGFYEDFEVHSVGLDAHDGKNDSFNGSKPWSLSAPATAPPMYVLESNLETQKLWYATAGKRPKQPDSEREQFEKIWSKNFESSAVNYRSQPTKQIAGDRIPRNEFGREVVYRGISPFSHSASKSFPGNVLSSLTLQLPRYRIVLDGQACKHAEFLVVISVPTTTHGTSSFGIWRRHSDFRNLSKRLVLLAVRHRSRPRHDLPLDQQEEPFKNAILSWQCVLQRKKWIRCVDKEYLTLKCFLLERFLHDVLFESDTPNTILDFLGLQQ